MSERSTKSLMELSNYVWHDRDKEKLDVYERIM